ncbi:phosphatase PAP2 family protein [Rhodococcus sp. NPDC059234]|uniref:phosphatase PAP2 family protein n=1 Tax=Rhodococcus sp. NPDC059234 TaxID=3346781 RepID=UPI00366DD7E3
MNILNRRVRVRPERLSAAFALGVVGLAVFGLAVHTTAGQVVDQALMARASTSSASGFSAIFVGAIVPFTLVGGVLVALLVVMGEQPLRLAGRVALVTFGPIVTAWWLKRALNRPSLDGLVMHNSFPSGTLTAVAAVACTAVLATPRRWRPVAAVNAALVTTGTAVTVVVLRWHRPSDALGALLIVGCFTLIASAFTTTDAPVGGGDGLARLSDPRAERLVAR